MFKRKGAKTGKSEKFADQLRDGETLLFTNSGCNAKIPNGNDHNSVPGALYVTNRRIVHDYAGTWGMGASRYQIPLRQVTTVTTGSETFTAYLAVTTLDGKTARFMLAPKDAAQVADIILDLQAEAQ